MYDGGAASWGEGAKSPVARLSPGHPAGAFRAFLVLHKRHEAVVAQVGINAPIFGTTHDLVLGRTNPWAARELLLVQCLKRDVHSRGASAEASEVVMFAPGVRLAGMMLVFGACATERASAGPNLINNSGAEAGPIGTVIPGWNTTGTFEVVSYSAGGGFPTVGDPGSPTRGGKFFAGGVSSPEASAYQTIDLSAFAAGIDGGTQACTLSGWLGGFSSQDDHCDVFATFYDQDGGLLGQLTIGGVLSADRSAQTGMLFRTNAGAVPSGTRQVLIQIRMTRTAGSYNDGYADDLSFSLGAACPCDLNHDGLVEDTDFTIFVAAYNILDCADPTMAAECPSDFNHDGIVEDEDFTIFVKAYNDLLCP